MRYFGGVDYADDRSNFGQCVLCVDNDGVITPVLKAPDGAAIEKTGVDCPFGTSAAFVSLYRGVLPTGDVKTRVSELWIRRLLADYNSNTWWSENRGRLKPDLYVNTTGHVKPSVGLQIVPGFLDWFYRTFHDNSSPALCRKAIHDARLGIGPVVESHPRAFLYSAVERIFNGVNTGEVQWLNVLPKIAQYREKSKETGRYEKLESTYRFLLEHATLWLWDGYTLDADPGPILKDEHGFDAFLSALTAFAHAENQTITWDSAVLDKSMVEVEGHILILSQIKQPQDGRHL